MLWFDLCSLKNVFSNFFFLLQVCYPSNNHLKYYDDPKLAVTNYYNMAYHRIRAMKSILVIFRA